MESGYGLLQIVALIFGTLGFFKILRDQGWLERLVAWWSPNRKKVPSGAMSESLDQAQNVKYDSNVLSYYGGDLKNNYVFIKINRRKHKPTELTFFLGLEDGRTYELPDHPNTVVNEIGGTEWSAAGLKISVLESTRRTRILFNGLLRRGKRTEVTDEDSNYVEHVRFNCIFIANTKPHSRNEFWSSNLQTETLSRNPGGKSKLNKFINDPDTGKVEQCGSLLGQLTSEDSTCLEVFLRGVHQRLWGDCDVAQFERNICIVGLADLGITFHVNVIDVKNGLQHMEMGYMKNSKDELHPIKSLNFDVQNFLEQYEKGLEFSLQFAAGNRKCEANVILNRKSRRILYGGYPWDFQYEYCTFKLNLDGRPGFGIIQVAKPYSGGCPISLSLAKKQTEEKILDGSSETCTLSFDDKTCQNESLVGGKGASLAVLSAITTDKFTVPKGFCLTAFALEFHLTCWPDLEYAIEELVKACSRKNSSDVKECCQNVVVLMEETPLPGVLRNEILERSAKLKHANPKLRFAVRSSAVGEDSEDTSAAGQNSTYLGVNDGDEMIKSVARCWASLYAHQSVEYRRQHGLPIKAAMGVCVQEMVNAEAAGVLFTRHPTTGNPKEIVITSNYGLGERPFKKIPRHVFIILVQRIILPSLGEIQDPHHPGHLLAVVSALVDPDTITVERAANGALSVKSSHTGKKARKVSVDADSGGTREVELSAEESAELSVSPELAVRLAEIGVKLDQLAGAPRDLEWAVVGGQVYLLQCRPVTAIDAWTDFELVHELGSGVPNETDIFTFANVGEVLPMALTPLTASVVIKALNLGTHLRGLRHYVPETYTHDLFIVNMRCTINYMNLMLRQIEEKISLGHRVMEIAVCGHTMITPEIHGTARDRLGPVSALEFARMRTEMLVDLWCNKSAVATAEAMSERWRRRLRQTPWHRLTAPELHRALDELGREYPRMCEAHSHTSTTSVFYQVVMMSVLTEGSEDFTAEHYSDIALLLGSCSDVISAQVPVALKEIARTIRREARADEFKRVKPENALDWLKENCSQAFELVGKFIEAHGHRGIEEFELITETWGMRPEKFLATVQSMLDTTMDEEESAADRELSVSETVSRLQTPRKWQTRLALRWLLPSSRRAVTQREATKALVIEVVHWLRLGYRRLAELLADEGRLPDPELVFYLTHQELGQLLEGRAPALLRKAARRRKLRPALQRHKYKEVNHGLPRPIEIKETTGNSTGLQLQGTSVCNGLATGRACVALTLEEAAEIRPGDILITTATDIGWSPYFPLLGGVVTELGGLISHGAVVAREYGLPCIVGAEGATRIFKTGEIITLNGYTGQIQVIKEDAKKVS